MNFYDVLIKEIEKVEQEQKEEKKTQEIKEREQRKIEREQKKKEVEQRKIEREQKKKEMLASKRNRSTKGILQVGCGDIIPYQYSFKLNDKVIYVNMCLAGGQRVNELMGYLCGCDSNYGCGKYNKYEDIDDFITTWCKFKYKLLEYDNYYYVMYIYNKMYDIDFNELVLNNEVSLKDIINNDNTNNNKTNENKYADLD